MLYSKEELLKKVSEVKSIDNDTLDYIISMIDKEISKRQSEFLSLKEVESLFKLQGSINSLTNLKKQIINTKALKTSALDNSYIINDIED